MNEEVSTEPNRLEEGASGYTPSFADVVLVIVASLAAGTLLAIIVFQVIAALGHSVDDMSLIIVGSVASALVYIAVVPSVYLLVIRRRNVSWSDIGLRRPGRRFVPMTMLVWVLTFIATVLVAILVTNTFGETPPDVSEQLGVENETLGSGEIFWLVLVSVVIAPITEEIVFRGLLFDAFRARWSFVVAALASAAIFAVSHQAVLTIPGLVVLGLALAWLKERFDSVYPPMLLHALNNGFAISVLVLTMNASAV